RPVRWRRAPRKTADQPDKAAAHPQLPVIACHRAQQFDKPCNPSYTRATLYETFARHNANRHSPATPVMDAASMSDNLSQDELTAAKLTPDTNDGEIDLPPPLRADSTLT